MKKLLLLFGILTVFGLTLNSCSDDDSGEGASIVGTWKLVSAKEDGVDVVLDETENDYIQALSNGVGYDFYYGEEYGCEFNIFKYSISDNQLIIDYGDEDSYQFTFEVSNNQFITTYSDEDGSYIKTYELVNESDIEMACDTGLGSELIGTWVLESREKVIYTEETDTDVPLTESEVCMIDNNEISLNADGSILYKNYTFNQATESCVLDNNSEGNWENLANELAVQINGGVINYRINFFNGEDELLLSYDIGEVQYDDVYVKKNSIIAR